MRELHKVRGYGTTIVVRFDDDWFEFRFFKALRYTRRNENGTYFDVAIRTSVRTYFVAVVGWRGSLKRPLI
jgi:hypothetical protein